MRLVALLVLCLLSTPALAGDEFQSPVLRDGTGYESTEPRYRVVGVQDYGVDHTLWVVTDKSDVVDQERLNRIIKDIRVRNQGFTSIAFYSSVRNEPRFPSFHISDLLAVYSPSENKTHFGVATGNLYGGWAHGPTR